MYEIFFYLNNENKIHDVFFFLTINAKNNENNFQTVN